MSKTVTTPEPTIIMLEEKKSFKSFSKWYMSLYIFQLQEVLQGNAVKYLSL
jgi:hypothetical protein